MQKLKEMDDYCVYFRIEVASIVCPEEGQYGVKVSRDKGWLWLPFWHPQQLELGWSYIHS